MYYNINYQFNENHHCLKISSREDGWWTQYLKSQFSSEISDFTVGLLGSTDWRFNSFGM